ncbi:hypothetical protein ACQ4LE_004288 [Meloidogyne hapla]
MSSLTSTHCSLLCTCTPPKVRQKRQQLNITNLKITKRNGHQTSSKSSKFVFIFGKYPHVLSEKGHFPHVNPLKIFTLVESHGYYKELVMAGAGEEIRNRCHILLHIG